MPQLVLRDPHVRMTDQEGRSAEVWRTDAHTDMDRIWYAPEFRRLEGVTQVVPPQEEYVFHDRLTHSMKVAQVGATLARMLVYRARPGTDLGKQLADFGIQITDWIDPDYCYAAGLAHDIGHPPYGHAGEDALQKIHKPEKILATMAARSFEGNAQSLRIVAKLSFRKANQDGLNLTLRSLAGIAKYPWLREKHPHLIEKLKRKWSFYPEEADVLVELERYGFIKTVKERLAGANGGRPEVSLVVSKVYRWPEAEIMDWADDISYAVHDIEDFFRAGRIPLHRIAAALKSAPVGLYGRGDDGDFSEEWLTTTFPFAENDDEVQAALVYARLKLIRQLDQDGDSLAGYIPDAFVAIDKFLLAYMPSGRFDGSRASHTILQNFGSTAITYLSQSTALEVIEVDNDKRLAFRVEPVAQLVAEFFKAICQYFVINTSVLATMQKGQAQSIERLIEGLRQLATNWVNDGFDMDVHTLPARLGEYLRIRSEETGVGKLDESQIDVAVIDYVCGLRDLQATILEARLFGDLSSLNMSSNWLDA